jgi:hypothetical protein
MRPAESRSYRELSGRDALSVHGERTAVSNALSLAVTVGGNLGAYRKLTRIFDILIVGIQLGLTFTVLVCLYMVFAILDYQGGFDSFIGMAFFQPIMAALLSGLTIICCMTVGLPIRLIKNLKEWWTRHFYLAFILALVGLTLIGLSFTPHFIEERTVSTGEMEIVKSIPNLGLVITGWLVTAFSLLHIYPPHNLKVKAQLILTELTGIK